VLVRVRPDDCHSRSPAHAPPHPVTVCHGQFISLTCLHSHDRALTRMFTPPPPHPTHPTHILSLSLSCLRTHTHTQTHTHTHTHTHTLPHATTLGHALLSLCVAILCCNRDLARRRRMLRRRRAIAKVRCSRHSGRAGTFTRCCAPRLCSLQLFCCACYSTQSATLSLCGRQVHPPTDNAHDHCDESIPKGHRDLNQAEWYAQTHTSTERWT
jgi:hypothetical protein